MTDARDEPIVAAIAALERALDEVGAPYMVIGGMAVILRGVTRLTEDVDATIWAEGLAVERVLGALASHEIVGRIPDFAEFARENQVLLLRHVPSGTPIEVSLAWLPFERAALARAERLEIGRVTVPVARAEDLVVYKAIAWRERDRADIARLLIAHRGQIDLARVRELVREFAEALEEPERVKEFEELVDRTLRRRRR